MLWVTHYGIVGRPIKVLVSGDGMDVPCLPSDSADVVKLVATLDLDPSAVMRESSSLSVRTLDLGKPEVS